MERGTLQPTTFVTEKKERDVRGFDRVMSFAIKKKKKKKKKIDKADSCQEIDGALLSITVRKRVLSSGDSRVLLVGIMLAEPCNDPNSVSNGAC